ncbi:MAG: relaxase/mobilization nuclease domain-containing protein [Defluviitaleaceae bacterium]|nr:relaxase/mobilization nuclease domain-containing protein [Defluviitaleaceae bacterium]
MAVTKLGNTKSAFNSINYFEKKAEVKSGLNCTVEMAKEQFKATREIFGKNGGVQAHTIIQSFKPGEVTPEQAS